ncbi:hypothetical protein HAX54_046313 [Datura stramonium]|uniref:Uncharacterized protein n=1 Tax=Datura stramonium TaxID=4076 RepID=A0ABS8WGS5_DATST|nr:hypothetical protein [Datura stramonium]
MEGKRGRVRPRKVMKPVAPSMLNFHISGSRSGIHKEPQSSTQLPVTPNVLQAKDSTPGSLDTKSLVGRSLVSIPISNLGSILAATTHVMEDPVGNVPLQTQNRANWTGLFSSNRAVVNNLTLNYVTPKVVNGAMVVKLDKNEGPLLEKKLRVKQVWQLKKQNEATIVQDTHQQASEANNYIKNVVVNTEDLPCKL